MRKHHLARGLVCLLLAAGLICSAAPVASAAQADAPSLQTDAAQAAALVDLEQAKADLTQAREAAGLIEGAVDELDPDETVRVIVQTSIAPAVGKEDSMAYTASAKQAEADALNQQETVIRQAEAITGNAVINQSAYLVNTFTMDMTVAEMEKVAELNSVTAVYPATRFELKMSYASQMTTVRKMWQELGYSGEGTVIAIIDTGVPVNHPDMKLSDGTAVKITRDDALAMIEKLGYGKYYSDKIPFAYSYTGFYEMDNSYKTHGMHVSGIAAGNGGEDGITGIAPEAQILGLQVFGMDGGAYTDDIIRAVEDAVKLGADVMNLSLGSTAGFYGDMEFLQAALEKATADGVLCCVAAGNDGTSASLLGINTNDLGLVDTGAVSAPSTAPSALSVASVNNDYYRGNKITVTDEDGMGEETVAFNFSQVYDSLHEQRPARYGWALLQNLYVADCGLGSSEEISAISSTLSQYRKNGGYVALVERGEISFQEKINNCMSAGAKAVVIYNNEDSDYVPNDVSSGSAGTSSGKPYQIMVSGNFGTWMKARDGKKVSFGDLVGAYVAAKDGGEMSVFSSWGPTPTLDIKPELSAPGGNIYSLSANGGYETMSGTSMATPYVSGASALVLQAVKQAVAEGKLNPGSWNEAEYVKLALMNTADPLLYPEQTTPYSVRQQGAGMIDPAGAAGTTVLATYQGAGGVALQQVGTLTRFTIDLTNYGTQACTYTLADSQVYTEQTLEDGTYAMKPAEGAKISFDVSSVTVPAGGTASVRAALTVSGLERNHYVEGFVTLNGVGCETIGLPVLGFYGDWYGVEQIIDEPVYTGQSILSDLTGRPGTTLAAGDYYAGMTDEGVVVEDYLSFSPNNDGDMDIVYAQLGMLRSAERLTVEILDAQKSFLRTIASTDYVPKTLAVDITSGDAPFVLLCEGSGWGAWDGTVYNQWTGKQEACPEGQYYVKITANMPGSSQTQSVIMPVKLDVTAPELEILSASYDESQRNINLQFCLEDGVAVYNWIIVYVNGQGRQINLQDLSYDADTGVYSASTRTYDYVPGQMNEIAVYAEDYAGNGTLEYYYTEKTGAYITYSTLTNQPDSWYESFQFTDTASKLTASGDSVVYFWDVRGVVSQEVKRLSVNGKDAGIQSDLSFACMTQMVPGENEIDVVAYDDAGSVLVAEKKLLYFGTETTTARIYPSCYPETYDEHVFGSYFPSVFAWDTEMEHGFGYYTYYPDVVPMTVEVSGPIREIRMSWFDPAVHMQMDMLDLIDYYADHVEGASYVDLTLKPEDLTQGDDGLYYAGFDLPAVIIDVPDSYLNYSDGKPIGQNYAFITLVDIAGFETKYLVHIQNDGMTTFSINLGECEDMDILDSGLGKATIHQGFEWIKPLDDMQYPFVFTREDLDENGCVHFTGRNAAGGRVYANSEVVTEDGSDEFAFDFRMRPGVNYLTVWQDIQSEFMSGTASYQWALYYLPEPTCVKFDRAAIYDGAVIYTYSDTYNVSGKITSYIDGNNLQINAENVRLGGQALTAPDGEAAQFPFSEQIELHMGENPVVVELENEAAEHILVNFTIYRLMRAEVVTPQPPVFTNPVQQPVTDEHVCPSGRFTDVNTELWYHDAVDFVVSAGLFNGTAVNKFSPDANMTRGMFVTVLGRLAGVNTAGYSGTSFTDVQAGQWYAPYVQWASSNGIVNGVGNNCFEPDQSITREQAAAILYRYAAFAAVDTTGARSSVLERFSDCADVSGWAVEPMAWCVENGIMQGSNGRLAPKATATRAQVAQLMMKFAALLDA